MISAHKMIKLLHFVLTIYSRKSSNFARKINYLNFLIMNKRVCIMALATLLTGRGAARDCPDPGGAATLTFSCHYSITVYEWVISG